MDSEYKRSMKDKKIKLLFITQKINQNDDDLAFVILWIKEFIRQGVSVHVISLEKGDFDGSFPVYSLGKEGGASKLVRIFRFLKLIFRLKYDRVFVHMNPEYVTLGGWYWFFRGIPTYLWYTHYKMHIHLWLSGIFCKRMFAATKQSLPQYNENRKKVITGHGIDMNFWLKDLKGEPNQSSPYNLLTVHRICRSKRLELSIGALNHLPKEYNLTIYGRDVEKDYYEEIVRIIKQDNLEDRVFLKGPLPMWDLLEVYPKFRIMINMASETIDKTMLEGMLFGIYPVTTPGNSEAIGLPIWPEDETPEALAKFILDNGWKEYDNNYLKSVVRDQHSLSSLITKMNKYIKQGQ